MSLASPMKTTPLLLVLMVPVLTLPALAAGGAGGESQVQPASRLEVAMTLYAGGITMGHMDLDATQRGGEYHAVSTLQTSGVVNAFWQSEIQATSTGKMGANMLSPQLYDSFDINRTGKKQEVSLTDEQWFSQTIKDVYFDYDSAEIRADAQATISANAAGLNSKSQSMRNGRSGSTSSIWNCARSGVWPPARPSQ